MPANIGISDKGRQAVAKILSSLLADEFVLYAKTRNYHWNVTGPQFSELHKFFEAQYDDLEDFMDDTAERVRQLGVKTPASLAEYLRAARLREHPGTYPPAARMLANLLADHETLVRQLRKDLEACASLGDMGNSDFLTGLMEKHEKMAWMLRAYGEK